MISALVILLALILSIITVICLNLNLVLSIILAVLFTILYIIIIVILWFIILFIISSSISKKKTYKYSEKWRTIFTNYCDFFLHLTNVKVNYIGKEKLPRDTNFVIVSNHRSNIDSFVIDTHLRDQKMIFAAKKSLFKLPGFGKMIHRIGYLKLERDNPKKDLKEILRGIDWLKNENISIGIFPEGTRNKNGYKKLLPFMDGCFNLVTKSHKPLVISTLKGTREVNNNLLFKRHDVTFEIIDVMYYDDYKDLNTIQIGEIVKNKIEENLNK